MDVGRQSAHEWFHRRRGGRHRRQRCVSANQARQLGPVGIGDSNVTRWLRCAASPLERAANPVMLVVGSQPPAICMAFRSVGVGARACEPCEPPNSGRATTRRATVHLGSHLKVW